MIRLVALRVRGGYSGKPMSYDLALEEAWFQQAAPCMLVRRLVRGDWERAEYAGEGSIGYRLVAWLTNHGFISS